MVIMIASFLTPFTGSSINVAMPLIGKDLNMTAVLLSWVATAYLLGSAIFLIPFGALADLYGRRLFFLWGMTVFMTTSLLMAFVLDGWVLVLLRAIQGIGGAMAFATAMPILISVFPPEERGKVIGLNTGVVYIGLSLGPFIGGFLTTNFGWSSVFLVNVPIALLSIVFGFFGLPKDDLKSQTKKIDYFGSVLYVTSLFALMYGFSTIKNYSGVLILVAGFLLLATFIKWELKLADPLLDVRLFCNNRVFALSNLAALINYSATFAISFLLSLYLQQVKGLSPQSAGVILISQPVIQAIFSPLSGRLSDKIEPQLIASIGMFLTTMGLVLLFFLKTDSSNAFIIPCLALLGFSFALFSSPNTNAVMSSVGKKLYATASSTLGTMRITGQTMSMGIASFVLAQFLGDIPLAAATVDAFMLCTKICFAIFAVLCGLGIFASFARGKVH